MLTQQKNQDDSFWLLFGYFDSIILFRIGWYSSNKKLTLQTGLGLDFLLLVVKFFVHAVIF